MQVSADWNAVSNLLTFGYSSAEEVRQNLLYSLIPLSIRKYRLFISVLPLSDL